MARVKSEVQLAILDGDTLTVVAKGFKSQDEAKAYIRDYVTKHEDALAYTYVILRKLKTIKIKKEEKFRIV